MFTVLYSAIGCVIALAAYDWLFGFGLSDGQIKELGQRLDDIVERLPEHEETPADD